MPPLPSRANFIAHWPVQPTAPAPPPSAHSRLKNGMFVSDDRPFTGAISISALCASASVSGMKSVEIASLPREWWRVTLLFGWISTDMSSGRMLSMICVSEDPEFRK